MAAFASLLLASGAAVRVASLNLCTDEYLLLLARPGQIASVSYLSQDPLESPLWPAARQHHGNRGSIEDVVSRRPSVVLTMGGGGRSTALLARRLRMKAVDLSYPSTLNDVIGNVHSIANITGTTSVAQRLVGEINWLRATSPRSAQDAIWISGRGDSLGAGSLGAEWLRLAGLKQRPLPGSRATLEQLLVRPPAVLVRSDYRSRQASAASHWLDHPIVRRAGARQIATDGRRWTCMGPLMISEIERLRRLAQ